MVSSEGQSKLCCGLKSVGQSLSATWGDTKRWTSFLTPVGAFDCFAVSWRGHCQALTCPAFSRERAGQETPKRATGPSTGKRVCQIADSHGSPSSPSVYMRSCCRFFKGQRRAVKWALCSNHPGRPAPKEAACFRSAACCAVRGSDLTRPGVPGVS